MINLNVQTKLPKVIKWYVLCRILIFFGLISMPFGILGGADAWYGAFVSFGILIGVPFWTYAATYNSLLTFVVTETNITVNSGVLFKHSKTIAFDKVQNVTTDAGLIARAFGIARLNIWTSSPSQIIVHKGEVNSRPDEFLELKTEDVEFIKGRIMKRA